MKGISSIAIMVILILLAAIGGTYYAKKENLISTTTTTIKKTMTSLTTIQTTTTTKILTTTTVETKFSGIDLEIELPWECGFGVSCRQKTSAKAGEEFKGQYVVWNRNSSNTFKTFIATICGREGYEKKLISKGIGSPGYLAVLQPCEITQTSYKCCLDDFLSNGTYIFELEIYDCNEIENKLGVNCSVNIAYDKVIAKVSPIKTMKKIVNVTGVTSLISDDKALDLANNHIQSKCSNIHYNSIDKKSWDMNSMFIAILKTEICPDIENYKNTTIWEAIGYLNENKCSLPYPEGISCVIVVTYVGIDGKFKCSYGIHKYAAPGITKLEKVC